MKSFAVISVLASVAYAASSATANPLIPTDISSTCSNYLTALDSDQSMLTCSSALVKATSAFGAGSSSSNPSASTVNGALNTFCGASSACSEDLLRSKLTAFYAACQPELTTAPNEAVIRTYDVLYALFPLTKSVCSKADNGKYCVVELGSSTGSSSNGATPSGKVQLVNSTPDVDLKKVQANLWTPASSGPVARRDEQAFYPNTTTFHDANILFLLLKSTLSTDKLCVSCTRSVLSAYIDFESAIPYAPGIAKSPLMSGQTALYQGVTSACGPSFLSGSVQAAGGISGGIVSSGALDVVASFKTVSAALSAAILGFYVAL
jgi:hypothetical protein